MHDDPKYWFPAKKYGWGWGYPVRWQGLVVFWGYIALLAFGAILPLGETIIGFLTYTALLSVIAVVICWKKGEPPSWRWGK
ncbi:hypothetical protein [Chitinolyticbacter meiyuanensis]|uniref:hypothetical protein n=1 Tax=Chitinolyticbacter meiyuanensis TaxID=682798 RepID=UPI0011E60719|nr:hypothetical protein [Chitinolyticbacter meiyuanensis]